MRFLTVMLISIIVCVIFPPLWGCNCPLDHLFVGCNEDGIEGTGDDDKLFINCQQKYRHSDPLGYPPPHPIDYLNPFYPLYLSDIPPYDWAIGEPGFDTLRGDIPSYCDAYDPIRCLIGDPDVDYRVVIECVSITPGFIAEHYSYYPPFNILIDEPGDSFNLSGIGDGCHLHLGYHAADGTGLFWITWQMYDELGQYEPSEPFTIVFNIEPLS